MRARLRWAAESRSLAGVAPAAPCAWFESRQPGANYVALASPDPLRWRPHFDRGQHSSERNIGRQFDRGFGDVRLSKAIVRVGWALTQLREQARGRRRTSIAKAIPTR